MEGRQTIDRETLDRLASGFMVEHKNVFDRLARS